MFMNTENDIFILFLNAKDNKSNKNKSIIEDKNNIFNHTINSDLEYNAIEIEIEQVKFNFFWLIYFFHFK